MKWGSQRENEANNAKKSEMNIHLTVNLMAFVKCTFRV